ncbi:MAG: helix-turn-helix domain-containing protein [Elainellaceae cyanobacterium]
MGDLIDLDKAEIIGQCAVHDPLIQNICKQFGGKNYRFAQMERLYQDALANLLAIHLVKTYSTQTFALPNLNEGLSSRQLKIILDYIHNHLEDEISLDDLARQLNLSRYYFSRLFKKSVGCSPYQYLIRQRVKLAQKLLICQDSSIADIACQCGFSNQSSMTKHFKQQTGVTPSHYRDRLSDYQPGVYFSGTSPGSTVHTGTH